MFTVNLSEPECTRTACATAPVIWPSSIEPHGGDSGGVCWSSFNYPAADSVAERWMRETADSPLQPGPCCFGHRRHRIACLADSMVKSSAAFLYRAAHQGSLDRLLKR